MTSNALSEVLRDLLLPTDSSSLIASNMFLRDWVLAGEQDVHEIQNYLRTIRDNYDVFTAFFVSERTGSYYYHDGVLKAISQNDSHDIWNYAFVESDSEVGLDVDTDGVHQLPSPGLFR